MKTTESNFRKHGTQKQFEIGKNENKNKNPR
jgi:hypothetical protein